MTVVGLAPLGILLGVPFSYGLRVLERSFPHLTPWAWAINGCSSVIGSVATVVVSMNFGFAAVLWTATVVYAVAFYAVTKLPAPAPRAVFELPDGAAPSPTTSNA
jgi:ABC-type Mn2+/Zn2+ transport system permease subunit